MKLKHILMKLKSSNSQSKSGEKKELVQDDKKPEFAL